MTTAKIHVGGYYVNERHKMIGEGTASYHKTYWTVENWKGQILFESFDQSEARRLAERFKDQFNLGWKACGEKVVELSKGSL